MRVIAMVCLIGIWLIYGYFEVMLIIANPWNIINPMSYIWALWYTITTPIVWLLIIGYLVGIIVDLTREKSR